MPGGLDCFHTDFSEQAVDIAYMRPASCICLLAKAIPLSMLVRFHFGGTGVRSLKGMSQRLLFPREKECRFAV